jgi:hypothetical protein
MNGLVSGVERRRQGRTGPGPDDYASLPESA